MATNLKLCCTQCLKTTNSICFQLLFDCKTFFLMFLNHEFIEAAQIIESKLNVIDLKLLEVSLNQNAKLFVQRTFVIFCYTFFYNFFILRCFLANFKLI